MAKVDDCLEKARAQTTKIESINVILDRFRVIIDSNAADALKLEQLDSILGDNNTAIDAVVTENTPPEQPV